jgi:hypothetical protein
MLPLNWHAPSARVAFVVGGLPKKHVISPGGGWRHDKNMIKDASYPIQLLGRFTWCAAIDHVGCRGYDSVFSSYISDADMFHAVPGSSTSV